MKEERTWKFFKRKVWYVLEDKRTKGNFASYLLIRDKSRNFHNLII